MIFRAATYGLVGAAAAWLAVLATDHEPPTTVIRVSALNTPIQPGGTLRVKYQVRRWRSCPVKIERTIFDAENSRFTFKDLDYKMAPGGMGEVEETVPVEVPLNAVQGPARYVVITTYTCNWLQKLLGNEIVVKAPDIPFAVEGPPLPIQIVPFPKD